jgi:uncharacterized membrane protein YedE/YeeE
MWWLSQGLRMRFMSRFLAWVLRLAMVAMGLVFGVVVVLAGLVLGLTVVAWSLLRGRKPAVMRLRMNPGMNPRSPFEGMRRAAPQGDVVDIEAREVPDIPQQLPRDRG